VIYIVMGVSGCGKSAVGRALAEQLHLPFHDADDFHPPANKQKMAQGQPLNDDDRAPWLANLASHFKTWNQENGSILACSALKRAYRDALRAGGPCVFIHLVGSRELITRRLGDRKGHFFNPALLGSQLATLEPPPVGAGDAAICVSINQPIDATVNEVAAMLSRPAS
jgi:carbohydrate kinase (thermoresistant glucokinase family)